MEYQTPRKLESAPSGANMVSGDSFEVAEGLHLQFFSNKFIKTPLPAAAIDPALQLARKQSRRERMRTLTSSLDGVDLDQIRQEAKEREGAAAAAPPAPEDSTNSNNVIPPASTAQPIPMLSPSSKQKGKVSFNNEELEKVRTIPPRERRPSANRKPSLSPRKSVHRKASQSMDMTLFNELSSILKSSQAEILTEKEETPSSSLIPDSATTLASPRTLFQVGEESAQSKRSSVDAKVTEFLKSSSSSSSHRRTFSTASPATTTTGTSTQPPSASDIFRMELLRAKSEVQATLKPVAIATLNESSSTQDAVPPSAPESPCATTTTTELEITLSTQITSPPAAEVPVATASNDSATFISTHNNAHLHLQFLQPFKPFHTSSSCSVSSAGSSTLSMSPIGEGGSSSDGSVTSTPTPLPTHCDDTATATPPEASDISTAVLPSFQALNIHSSLFEHRSKVHSALHRRSQHGEGDETNTTSTTTTTTAAQPPIQPASTALAAAIAASRASPAPQPLPSFSHPPPRHASATVVSSRPSPPAHHNHHHQRNNSRSMSTDSVFATNSAATNPLNATASAAVFEPNSKLPLELRSPASPLHSSASSTSPSMAPVPTPSSPIAKIPSPLSGQRGLKSQHFVASPTNYRHSHSASLPTSPLFPQPPSTPSPVPPLRERTSPSMSGGNGGSNIFHSPRSPSFGPSSISTSTTATMNKHMKSFSLGAAPTPVSPRLTAALPATGTSLLPAISNLLSAASPGSSGASSSRAAAVNRMSSVGGRSESRRAVSDLTAALYILNRKR